MANRRYTSQFLYNFEAMPVLLSCNFIVDAANGNGLGLRSLKGEGIHAVYMHTSATPLAGNPNPAAGNIVVQFSDVYARALGGGSSIGSPLGSSVSSTTIHTPAVITSLGTATLAQWTAKGLPAGAVPALGLSFIATASGSIGGSATVAPPASSAIDHIEFIGDSSLDSAQTVLKQGAPLNPIGNTNGGYQLLQCLAANTLAQPADGTVISLSFLLSNSSVTVKGQ